MRAMTFWSNYGFNESGLQLSRLNSYASSWVSFHKICTEFILSYWVENESELNWLIWIVFVDFQAMNVKKSYNFDHQRPTTRLFYENGAKNNGYSSFFAKKWTQTLYFDSENQLFQLSELTQYKIGFWYCVYTESNSWVRVSRNSMSLRPGSYR